MTRNWTLHCILSLLACFRFLQLKANCCFRGYKKVTAARNKRLCTKLYSTVSFLIVTLAPTKELKVGTSSFLNTGRVGRYGTVGWFRYQFPLTCTVPYRTGTVPTLSCYLSLQQSIFATVIFSLILVRWMTFSMWLYFYHITKITAKNRLTLYIKLLFLRF